MPKYTNSKHTRGVNYVEIDGITYKRTGVIVPLASVSHVAANDVKLLYVNSCSAAAYGEQIIAPGGSVTIPTTQRNFQFKFDGNTPGDTGQIVLSSPAGTCDVDLRVNPAGNLLFDTLSTGSVSAYEFTTIGETLYYVDCNSFQYNITFSGVGSYIFSASNLGSIAPPAGGGGAGGGVGLSRQYLANPSGGLTVEPLSAVRSGWNGTNHSAGVAASPTTLIGNTCADCYIGFNYQVDTTIGDSTTPSLSTRHTVDALSASNYADLSQTWSEVYDTVNNAFVYRLSGSTDWGGLTAAGGYGYDVGGSPNGIAAPGHGINFVIEPTFTETDYAYSGGNVRTDVHGGGAHIRVDRYNATDHYYRLYVDAGDVTTTGGTVSAAEISIIVPHTAYDAAKPWGYDLYDHSNVTSHPDFVASPRNIDFNAPEKQPGHNRPKQLWYEFQVDTGSGTDVFFMVSTGDMTDGNSRNNIIYQLSFRGIAASTDTLMAIKAIYAPAEVMY